MATKVKYKERQDEKKETKISGVKTWQEDSPWNRNPKKEEKTISIL